MLLLERGEGNLERSDLVVVSWGYVLTQLIVSLSVSERV